MTQAGGGLSSGEHYKFSIKPPWGKLVQSGVQATTQYSLNTQQACKVTDHVWDDNRKDPREGHMPYYYKSSMQQNLFSIEFHTEVEKTNLETWVSP